MMQIQSVFQKVRQDDSFAKPGLTRKVSQSKIAVTKENVESPPLFAKEFCCEELQSECLKVLPDPISSLSERFFTLEKLI
jgi:hypothetical protein